VYCANLREEQLIPYYQPIVCADSRDVFAYEVLGRVDTSMGIRSLGPFFHNPAVAAAEKLRIDRSIWFKALNSLRAMRQESTLFLNIQPQWLLPFIKKENNFPTVEHLQSMNLQGCQVVIEIVEDEFCADMALLEELILRYRENGCKIAVDDFGEGFSSLERIIHLHPDFLKIGAGLLERSKEGNIGANILESIGILCEKIGTSLVLEEVETMSQFIMGLEAGVRYYQGYLFSSPRAEFIETDSFHDLVDNALQTYLEKKSRVHNSELHLTAVMNQYLNTVFNDENMPKFSASHLEYRLTSLISAAPEEWLRVYICNRQGYQISANYTRERNNRWTVQPEYRDRNWSWRPYFLPKVVEADQQGRGIYSLAYHDLESRQRIWTFIYPLTDQLILFIDCQYPDL
jgi:EAL domain-containing protein (putative c-di-GMP-specific phosphodiesterase class I)